MELQVPFSSRPPRATGGTRPLTLLTNQGERAKLYRQAEQLLHDDVGRLFIANNQPPLAFVKRAKGYVPHPTGSEYFNTVELQ